MKDFKKSCSYVTKLLAQHPRTVFEIENKLKKKGYRDQVVEETISFFKENNLLSDKEYARSFVENQIKYRPVGRILCKSKMLKKGLNKDLIDNILNEEFTEDVEQDLAQRLAKSKVREVRNKTKKEKISKIGQYLNRKGFSESMIWETLESLDLLN